MEKASVERSGRDPATGAIFDSSVPEGSGQAVSMEALAGDDRDEGIAIISRRSEARGAGGWSVADVTGPAALRLYRARASAHFVLGVNDERLAVRLG
jgi:hypothetical protein